MSRQSVYDIPLARFSVKGRDPGRVPGILSFAAWLVLCCLIALFCAYIPLEYLRGENFPFKDTAEALVPRLGLLPAFLPFALLWLCLVLALHIYLRRRLLNRILARRDDGIGLEQHRQTAIAAVGRWEEHLRKLLPPGTAVQSILIEATSTSALSALPSVGLVFLAATLAVIPLYYAAAWEGWSALFIFRVCLAVGLVSLLVEPVYHWTAFATALCLAVAWFTIPLVVPGAASSAWMPTDGLLICAVLFLGVRIIRQWQQNRGLRFLLICEEGLFLGVPRHDGTALIYGFELKKPLVVLRRYETYDVCLPARGGGDLHFQLQSRAELEHLEVIGPPPCHGLKSRMLTGPGWRGLLSFVMAVLTLSALTLAGVGLCLGRLESGAAMTAWTHGDMGKGARTARRLRYLLPWSASRQLTSLVFCFEQEEFEQSLLFFGRLKWWTGEYGAAGLCARGLEKGGYTEFCSRACDIVSRPEAIDNFVQNEYEVARRYVKLTSDVQPRLIPGAVLYGLVLRRLRQATEEARTPNYEASFLLARLLGGVAFSYRVPTGLDRKRQQSWYAESFRLMKSVRGKVPGREWLAASARISFRKERYKDAVRLLKQLSSKKDKLMLASAARFLGISNLDYHIRRVRKIGRDTASLSFQSKMLEALLLSARGEPGKARALLSALLNRSDIRGFMARFVNILIRDQSGIRMPSTDALEKKMRRALGAPAMEFTELPWPEWMAETDLDYLAAIRKRRDRRLLKRIASSAWYPFASRAGAHLKKLKN